MAYNYAQIFAIYSIRVDPQGTIYIRITYGLG